MVPAERWKIDEIADGSVSYRFAGPGKPDTPPDRGQHLDVEEMRRVQVSAEPETFPGASP